MKRLNKRTVVALGLSGAMTIGTASAKVPDIGTQPLNSIILVNNPEVQVAVSEGIATLFGNTESYSERLLAEEHVADIDGVEHVINLINWN